MASERKKMQLYMQYIRRVTGEAELDLDKVVDRAIGEGWTLPTPRSARDILKAKFTDAAREETRRDEETGEPYRANYAVPYRQGSMTLYLWVDTDRASRASMLKALVLERDQMLDFGVQIKRGESHWNRVNPDQQPIQLSMDFEEEIEWRRNGPDEKRKAS